MLIYWRTKVAEARRYFSKIRLIVIAGIVVAFAALLSANHVAAQQASNSLEDILHAAQSGNQTSTQNGETTTRGEQPDLMVLQPQTSQRRQLRPSRLEEIMSRRAGATLHQYGYDQFGEGQTITVPRSGAVQDGYVLGSGDEIVISLRGQENSQYKTTVDREGRVLLPRLAPLTASGKTLGQFRTDLEAAVKQAYISTQAFVSLGRLRQISVMVAGDVANPGMRLVTGLSSPLDAILLSGGINKTGSLRNVKVIRDDRQITVDLYGLLSLHAHVAPILLTDGDRVVVPSLGSTVAVTGWVRHPGIYELAPGSKAVTVRSLLLLAGGLEVRGRYRESISHILSDGSASMAPTQSEGSLVRDGEVLFVQPAAQHTEQDATLAGNSPLAGPYSVGRATTLAEILKAPGALGSNPYILFGMIVRRDPVTLVRSLVPFSPVGVLTGRENLDLRSGDVVRIFSAKEAHLLMAVDDAFRTWLADSEQKAISPDTGAKQIYNRYGEAIPRPIDNERTEIAKLSAEMLGEGGLLIDRQAMSARASEYLPENGGRRAQGDRNVQSDQSTSTNNAANSQTILNDQSQFADQSTYAGDAGIADNQNYNSNMSSPYIDNSQYPASAGNTPTQNGSGARDGSGNQARNLPYSQSVPPENLQEEPFRPNVVPTNREVTTFGELSRQLDVDALVLIHFLMDNDVTVGGSVRGAGRYLVGPRVSLQDLVAAAGGTTAWTDENRLELVTTDVSPSTGQAHTSRQLLKGNPQTLASYMLRPHDEVRFNPVYTDVGAGSVQIRGQVRYPGRYDIERGERLSELLLRAGGLTDVAYPYGTVFLRKSDAATERAGFQRAAQEMQDAVFAGMTRLGSDKISPDAVTAMRGLISDLRNATALGRISVVADPALLIAHPSRDPLLESGDVIYLPQRPSTVTVLGQVMHSGSFVFDAKESASEYIDQAGGYGQFADKSLTYVILPDGSSRAVESSWLSIGSDVIPPGSTIVVPRDMSPIDLRQIISDTAGILGQLALAAASLAVLSHN
jgi:protein involved in polysaccharide export with SLBB domain